MVLKTDSGISKWDFVRRDPAVTGRLHMRIIVEQTLVWKTSLSMVFVYFLEGFDSVDKNVL